MDPLHELAQIVSRNKTKRIEIIGHPGNYNSRSQKLYEALASGKTIDEGEISRSLFPSAKNQRLSYSRLRQRLFKRLINTLFFIDIDKPSFTEFQRAYYSCYRDFAALKILLGRSGRTVSEKLGEKILKRALEFEFTDLSVDVLRSLRIYYSSATGNNKSFQRMNQLFKSQKAKLDAEDLAEEYFSELAIHYVQSRAAKTELAFLAKQFSEKLYTLESECDTQRFHLIAFNVHTIRFQIENNFEKTIQACERAIELLSGNRKLRNPNTIRSFLNIKASANIKLGKYDEAHAIIRESLDLSDKGTVNWYVTLFYSVLLYFHTQQYQKLLPVFREAISNNKFKNLPPAHKECWVIADACLNYLIASGKIELNLREMGDISQFRIQKFLNEVPVYSKDKRGANISILILQILFLLQKKKYQDTIPRLDKLKIYSNKYLRKSDTYRSNCFIHMLMQLPKSYFNRIAAIRKTKKYMARLNEMPLDVAVQSSEMELIPYERLWEMVLKSLKG